IMLANMERELGRDMQASLAHEKEALAIYEDIDQRPKVDENGEGGIPKSEIRDGIAELNTRVGVAYLRLGNISEAAVHFRKALDTQRERLTEVSADPKLPLRDKLLRKQSVAVSLLAVGGSAYRLGDSATASGGFVEALAEYDEMLAQSPKSPDLQRALSGACLLVGDFYLRSGDNAKAADQYRRAQALLGDLARTDPNNFYYQWDLGFAHYRLGLHALRAKDANAAKDQFQKCLKIRQALADKDKTNERRKMELMLVLAHVGEHAKAAEVAAELEKTVKPDAEFLIDLGRTYAQCAAAAPSDL